MSWVLGTGVLQFDADVFGLAKTAEALAMYYTDEVPPPPFIYIFSNSASALHAISHALVFHQSLTTLSLRHSDLRLFLVWTPVNAELEGHWMARERETEACKRNPPEGLNCVQSAAFQKARACTLAFHKWGMRWYEARLIPVFRAQASGGTSPIHPKHSSSRNQVSINLTEFASRPQFERVFPVINWPVVSDKSRHRVVHDRLRRFPPP
ncbi:hypothetical protein EDB86DRAFT_3094546 [Lactarius hatsudake]|nr:hypothetical protein EDB86DRAFT_3094546 [Lactarius hatsudake]